MGRELKWTIEDDVVALYLALYADQGLQCHKEEIEDVISNTLFPKKGFNMRVQNYRYIVSDGKEGLDAGYPDGFPPYKELYRIFSALGQCNFRDYVNLILDKRKSIMKQRRR